MLEVVEQPPGVLSDPEEPLRDASLFDGRITTLTAP